jgi:hypothetical protein
MICQPEKNVIYCNSINRNKMEYTEYVKKAYRISLFLYVAFMLSLVVYFGVFEFFKARIPDFQGVLESRNLPWLRYAFYAGGLAQIFFIKIVRGAVAKTSAEGEFQALIDRLQKVSMISAALCEVPAILGLVLFFIGGISRDFYILLMMSFVLFALYFPRYSNWEIWTRTRINHK